jgi:FMN phosphatase YigB (HAD superfamily)
MEQFVLPALEAVGPWPGVSERLDMIAQLGVRQVIVSDFPVDAKLSALGLSSKFERGFAGTEIGALKPHPSVLAHVFAVVGVEPAEVVHVGDRLDTDGRAADRAGVGFVHVVHGDFVPVDVLVQRRMR